jgi:beta-lactamase regulating signal transducer with metallopeptidase domain
MKFAHYLSIVMTAVLLSLVWIVGILPVAGIMRLVGIKRIDRSFRAERASYWEARDSKYDDFQRLKLQY